MFDSPHPRPTMEIEGFVMVGGASSRMGRDKARLTLEGRSFIEHIAEALSAIAGRVNLVGDRDVNSASVFANVPDVYRDWGALGGLHAALAACRAEWAAIVACDLPFVTKEMFLRLSSVREEHEAVAPLQADGRLQPLCALYRKKPCEARARQLIERGERRPRALIKEVRARLVAWEELSDLEGAQSFFMNVNTPEDYSNALSRFGEASG